MRSHPWLSRDTAIGATIAIAAAGAAWWLHHRPIGLVSPEPCPGLLDAAAALTARLWPRAPLGNTLVGANVWLLGPAVAGTVLALRRWCGTWWIASAAGAAFVTQRWLDPAFSPFDPLPLLVVSLVALGFDWLGAAAPRARRVWIAGASAIAAILILRWLAPPASLVSQPACRSFLLVVDLAAWRAGWQALAGAAGPYALGLAALGLFTIAARVWSNATDRWRSPLWPIVVFAVVSTIEAAPGLPLVRNFAGPLVLFWIAVSVGLTELARACRRGVGGRVAAALLIVLLPLLHLPGLRDRPPAPPTFGIERLSLRDVRQLLAVLPDGSRLVAEDASLSALLRAAAGTSERMGKALQVVASDPERLTVLSAGSPAPTFALPRGQAVLQWSGFVLRDASLPGVSGIAEVAAVMPCVRIRPRWTDLSPNGWPSTRALSVTAPGVDAEHAVVLYVAFDAEPHPAVVEPAGGGRVGFDAEVRDLTRPEDEAPLRVLTQDDQIAPELLTGGRRFVARLEFWRSAVLPRVLGVNLGAVPVRASGRSTVPSSRDSVCPVVPYGARDVQIWQ